MSGQQDYQPGDTLFIQGKQHRITRADASRPFQLVPIPTRRCDTPRCPNPAPDTGVQIGPGAYLHLCDHCIQEMLPPELQPEIVR